MPRYEWYVMSDCDPDHREEFNRWYDEVHLADLLRIPGVVGARRLNLSPVQATTDQDSGAILVHDSGALPGQLPYLAIYEFETDDVKWVLDEVVRRAGTPEMEISEYLRDVKLHLYEKS